MHFIHSVDSLIDIEHRKPLKYNFESNAHCKAYNDIFDFSAVILHYITDAYHGWSEQTNPLDLKR